MCSIVSLVSFKSTERAGIKVFFSYMGCSITNMAKKICCKHFFNNFSFNIRHYLNMYQLCSNYFL